MWLEASRAIENSSHTNSECCLSVFDKEQGKSKQLSYKLLSINFHLCFTRSKESQNNFHTNFCLSTLIFVWRGARKVKTTFTQTLVYQLSSILIFVWPGARKVKTTFIRTLVYQLSSLFDQEQGKSKQLSHKLSSLFDQEQRKSKQLSYKLLSTNSLHQALSSLIWPNCT